MIPLLIEHPLLLLFIVAAIGYPLGRIKVGGASLGVAAVLFAGLAIGSLDPNLKLPELVYQLGLVLFVYTVGLSSGPGFVASFRRSGLRDNLFVVGMLGLAAWLAVAAYAFLQIKATTTAGLFSGSLTNTPALAGVLDYLKGYAAEAGLPPPTLDQLLVESVVAYSITYPLGVVGGILAIVLAQRWWRIIYATEAQPARAGSARTQDRGLSNRTVHVIRPEATRLTIGELVQEERWDVVFGRIKRASEVTLANGQARMAVGDLVTIVGAPEDLDRATVYLGEPSAERIDFDRRMLDYRRVFVSNPRVAGLRLRDVNLPQQFGAIVTRLRRGDVDFVPHGDTVLELGDRVRVLMPRQSMDAVSAFLGDSYRAVSEMDVLTFGLGLALGLLLGALPIPLPGGLTFRLGLAGGPLIAALTLGALRRTGPLVWRIPFSVNLTLRQAGLIMFLAGTGTRAGYAFLTAFSQGSGFSILAAGAAVSFITALATLGVGYRLLKIPMGRLIGMLAGVQTQPAVLSFALEQTGDEQPNLGYAAVYPSATISTILLAQLLLAVLP